MTNITAAEAVNAATLRVAAVTAALAYIKAAYAAVETPAAPDNSAIAATTEA